MAGALPTLFSLSAAAAASPLSEPDQEPGQLGLVSQILLVATLPCLRGSLRRMVRKSNSAASEAVPALAEMVRLISASPGAQLPAGMQVQAVSAWGLVCDAAEALGPHGWDGAARLSVRLLPSLADLAAEAIQQAAKKERAAAAHWMPAHHLGLPDQMLASLRRAVASAKIGILCATALPDAFSTQRMLEAASCAEAVLRLLPILAASLQPHCAGGPAFVRSCIALAGRCATYLCTAAHGPASQSGRQEEAAGMSLRLRGLHKLVCRLVLHLAHGAPWVPDELCWCPLAKLLDKSLMSLLSGPRSHAPRAELPDRTWRALAAAHLEAAIEVLQHGTAALQGGSSRLLAALSTRGVATLARVCTIADPAPGSGSAVVACSAAAEVALCQMLSRLLASPPGVVGASAETPAPRDPSVLLPFSLCLEAAAACPPLAAALASCGLLGSVLERAANEQRTALQQCAPQALSDILEAMLNKIEATHGGGFSAVLLAAGRDVSRQLVQHRQSPPAGAGLAALVPRALQVAQQLGAALHAYCQQPEQQRAALAEVALAAASRSCAFLRCANVGGRGGPDAGQGEGSLRCGGSIPPSLQCTQHCLNLAPCSSFLTCNQEQGPPSWDGRLLLQAAEFAAHRTSGFRSPAGTHTRRLQQSVLLGQQTCIEAMG
ncbi:hypothetical protein ABPG75_004602 [Micractinium tetrahymenae]